MKKKLTVWECENCHGTGTTVDWHYANQLGAPVGFSRAAAEREKQLVKLAYPTCGRCGGKGFTLEKETK